MHRISPSSLWARIFLDNKFWPMSRASGSSQPVLQSCGGEAQRSALQHPAVVYLIFAALWLFRYYAGIHALGWRIDVILGVTFGLAQQLMLVAPAAIVYASIASPDSLLQKRAAIAARWMLGLPPVLFGIFHLIGIRVFATIVPHWMSFGYFWAALTGIAFFLAGIAICSGKMDVLAARLLALMLLLFEGFVEIPPIFTRLHNEADMGRLLSHNVVGSDGGHAAVFAEFLAKPRRTRGNQRCPSRQLWRSSIHVARMGNEARPTDALLSSS